LALVELTKHLPGEPKVTTRLYPVDFDRVRMRLEEDLSAGFDVALHLGQAPGIAAIRLEMMAINVRRELQSTSDLDPQLSEDGPVAYRSTLPLPSWLPLVRQLGIPCELSYHAGTYLCNATLYWNRYLCERKGWQTRSAFIHLPLDPSQIAPQKEKYPSMPVTMVATALERILQELK
jgi:pyroglutamyl-peptidase